MSRTVWRVLSLCVLALTALLFAGWWGWVRAPIPDRVCEHVVEVTLRDAGETAIAEGTRERMAESIGKRCQKLEVDRIQLRGRLVYAEHAKCVMRSATLAEINRC
jgi:hypothetical protein